MTTKVFVSYSHANRKWIEAGQFGLIPWLASALRRRKVEFWYDLSDLARAPGADYRKRIERAILEADFALLLVSTDYLVSDFIREIEMPLIKKRLDRQELAVIPESGGSCPLAPRRRVRVDHRSADAAERDDAAAPIHPE